MAVLPPNATTPVDPQRPDLGPVSVIVHLSGGRRGTTQRLRGPRLRIGTAPDSEIHVAHEPSVGLHHATLLRRGSSYELVAEGDHPVWVNGRRVEDGILDSGDVIEVGKDGPILRFRLYPPGSRAYKSPKEAFSDCIECARNSTESSLGQVATLITTTPRELATQTSILFRVSMIIAMVVLLTVVAGQGHKVQQLRQRLEKRELEIDGISDLLEASSGYLSQDDLARVRTEISITVERVQALEERSGAPARVVSTASRSVAFLQGAFGFVDPESGEDLRFVPATEEGHIVVGPDGSPAVTIGGPGPPVEVVFSGSGFIATEDGLLLTNRHVALPWDYDRSAAQVLAFGLSPVMRRFMGYLPGISEPVAVSLVVASSSADLAVLRADRATGDIPPLSLSSIEKAPGDEVIVLGYPTGINALLARTDESLIDRLAERDSDLDVWDVARELAAAGHINPLASRGIVAQVTPIAVVFDAETTHGGSGGPVLDFDGQVVAVTSAIIPEFGGSNLGVPAAKARLLLLQAGSLRLLPPRIR